MFMYPTAALVGCVFCWSIHVHRALVDFQCCESRMFIAVVLLLSFIPMSFVTDVLVAVDCKLTTRARIWDRAYY